MSGAAVVNDDIKLASLFWGREQQAPAREEAPDRKTDSGTLLSSGESVRESPIPGRNRPLKIALGSGLAAWLIAVAALTSLDVIAHQIVLSDLRNYLARTALATAAGIDGDEFLQFTHPEQEETEQYRKATRPLAVLLETNPDIHFAYAGVTSGDRMHFVFDGTPLDERDGAGQPQHAAPMQEDKASPGEIEVTRTQKVTVELKPSATSWGIGIRAQAPIFAHTGQMVGYVGLTMRAERYATLVHRTDIAAAGGAILAAVLALLSSFAILRIERDRETIDRARNAAETLLTDERNRLREYALALDQSEHHDRRSIARTLHEGLQQTLTGLDMMLTTVRDHTDPKLPDLLRSASAAVREAQASTRLLIEDLAPPELDHASLNQMMGWVARLFDSRYRFKTTWSIKGQADLAADMRMLIYRMMREFLEYLRTELKGNAADVEIHLNPQVVHFQVMTPGAAAHDSGPPKTDIPIELRRIYERTRAAGGKFEIVSLPRGGCWAAVSIPLDSSPVPAGNNAVTFSVASARDLAASGSDS
jgi:hypothetical protein